MFPLVFKTGVRIVFLEFLYSPSMRNNEYNKPLQNLGYWRPMLDNWHYLSKSKFQCFLYLYEIIFIHFQIVLLEHFITVQSFIPKYFNKYLADTVNLSKLVLCTTDCSHFNALSTSSAACCLPDYIFNVLNLWCEIIIKWWTITNKWWHVTK